MQGADDELPRLITALREIEMRLEELTGGEVDAVADHEGRPFLLRHAQEQLHHVEVARQAAILNALPANIALLDMRGVVVSVNAAWRQFADANALHNPGHAVGIDYLAVCDGASGNDAEIAHEAAAGIRSVLDATARTFSLEYPCHSPITQRWFMMTVTPLAGVQPHGVVVMHIDITAEKLAEANLRSSESRFRQMAETINDVFFLRDAPTNRVLYVSPAYAEVWGRSCESLYANPESWDESIHPDDRLATQQSCAKGMLAPSTFEYRMVRPDGSVRWIQSRRFPIRDLAGSVFRVAGVAKDITERKQAEGELRESERRFSDMLDNVELASVMLDREARITYCNDYLLRLTGWRLDEVVGRNWFDQFLPAQRGDLKPFFKALLANSPEVWHRENEILTRSGELRSMRWNNSVLRSPDGDVIGSASIGEDITERKAADEVLAKHTAELERFHRLSVGRELQMIELKKELNALAKQAGNAPPYDLAFLDQQPSKRRQMP